jgi:hypothetical protein
MEKTSKSKNHNKLRQSARNVSKSQEKSSSTNGVSRTSRSIARSRESSSSQEIMPNEFAAKLLIQINIGNRFLISEYIGRIDLLRAKKNFKGTEEYGEEVPPALLSIQHQFGTDLGLKYIGKSTLEVGSLVGVYLGEVLPAQDPDASNHYQFCVDIGVEAPVWISAKYYGSPVTFINNVDLEANTALRVLKVKGKMIVVAITLSPIEPGEFFGICYSGNAISAEEMTNISKKHTICRFAKTSHSGFQPRFLCQMQGREQHNLLGKGVKHPRRNYACLECSQKIPYPICSRTCYEQHVLDCSGKGTDCKGNVRAKNLARDSAPRYHRANHAHLQETFHYEVLSGYDSTFEGK